LSDGKWLLTQSGLFFFELRMGVELGGKGINAEDAESAEGENAEGGAEVRKRGRNAAKKRLVTSSPTMKEGLEPCVAIVPRLSQLY
jgi:hypothetical protein